MTTTRSERFTSDAVDQKILGDAIELPFSKLVAKSRFLKGAMTERLASWDQHNIEGRGLPDEKLVRLYEEWGKGGFGIVLSACSILLTDPIIFTDRCYSIIHLWYSRKRACYTARLGGAG